MRRWAGAGQTRANMQAGRSVRAACLARPMFLHPDPTLSNPIKTLQSDRIKYQTFLELRPSALRRT